MSADGVHRSAEPVLPISSDNELDEELAQHLELLAARYVASGMSPEAALVAAHARFGNPAEIKRECAPIAHSVERRLRMTTYIDEARHDFVFALRTLRRDPLFTIVATVTLAVAIGTNTAMFSVVNGVLLRPLPYANAQRTTVLFNSYPGTGLLKTAVAPAEFAEFREQLSTFDAFAGVRPQPMSLGGGCGNGANCEVQRVSGYVVSPNVFTLLGARAALGRTFVEGDGAAGAPPVTVLSHALWVQRFGADPSILGRAVATAGIMRTIVGIMPPDVRFPDLPVGYLQEPAELWVPYSWERDREQERGNQNLVVLVRGRPGSTVAQQRAELRLIESRFKERFAERYMGPSLWRISDIPLRTEMVGDVRPALLLLWGIVGLVLLIACANVANLLRARSSSRATEMAVRAALGAGHGRLVRQLLTEALVLGVVAGCAGLVIAKLGVDVVRLFAPATLPQIAAVHVDQAMLLFAIAVTLGASVICGIVPALQLSRTDLQGSLRSAQRGAGGAGTGRRLRQLLVIGEVALTLVVLITAGLLFRTFNAAQQVTPAFDADSVLTFELTLPDAAYRSDTTIYAFHNALRARLATLPGVTTVSSVFPLPLDGGQWSGSYYPEGHRPGPNDEFPNAQYSVALPDYFATMRIRLRAGREFTADDIEGTAPVAIVSEALAARHWPGESAIGNRINTIDQKDGVYSMVIGVAPNVRRLGATDTDAPQIYLPLLQHTERRVSYVVRTNGDPSTFAQVVRDAVHAVDPTLPLARIAAMRELVDHSVAPQRFNAALLLIFAAIALLLASGGLFGVVSYLVTQRDHELAVRLALGGRPVDILRLIVGEGMSMAIGGIAVGLVIAWAVTRALQGLLFGVTRADPFTWASVALLLVFVCFIASWLPARRATHIDPATVLRG